MTAAPASPAARLPGNDPAYEWRIVTLLTIGFGLVGLDLAVGLTSLLTARMLMA